MARKITDENRLRIINLYKSKRSYSEIAGIFECSRATVERIVTTYLNEGRVMAKKCGGYKPPKLNDEHKLAIQQYISENCTVSLDQIRQRLVKDYGISVGRSTIDRFIKTFSFSLKRVSYIPERRNDSSVIEIRAAYAREFYSLQSQQDGNNIFFWTR
jgi:transposase